MTQPAVGPFMCAFVNFLMELFSSLTARLLPYLDPSSFIPECTLFNYLGPVVTSATSCTVNETDALG